MKSAAVHRASPGGVRVQPTSSAGFGRRTDGRFRLGLSVRWTGLLAGLGVACGAQSKEIPAATATGSASPPGKGLRVEPWGERGSQGDLRQQCLSSVPTDLVDCESSVSTFQGQLTAA